MRRRSWRKDRNIELVNGQSRGLWTYLTGWLAIFWPDAHRYTDTHTDRQLKTLKKLFKKWRPPGGRPVFSLNFFEKLEVKKMIKALKNSHAFGRDKLDAATFKKAGKIISPALTPPN